jgi:hypothetical protein
MVGDLDAAVREAIWLWDPYGIADVRSEVPEEYDDAVDDVLLTLRTVGTVESLEAWANEYRDGLGLRRNPATDRAFVERVWDAWAGASDWRA